MTLDYQHLSREQLIDLVYQQDKEFQEFSTNSSQVQALLLNQIKSLKESLTNFNEFKEKFTGLEIENDNLESQVRLLKSQLDYEKEMHNDCIEKIAILENDLEISENSIKKFLAIENDLQNDYNLIKSQFDLILSQNNILSSDLNKKTAELAFLQNKVDSSNIKYQNLQLKYNNLNVKFKKLTKILNIIKLKQSGLVKLYTTPALDPVQQF